VRSIAYAITAAASGGLLAGGAHLVAQESPPSTPACIKCLCLSQIKSSWHSSENRATLRLIRLIWALVVDLCRSRASLEAEVLVLRQQIIVLRRGMPTRPRMRAIDRLVLGWLCRLFPNARDALTVVRPETVLRWHRAGFRSYWRWKSRRRLGRPAVSAEIRADPRDEPCQSAVGGTADPW
jgi:hypothetical protein